MCVLYRFTVNANIALLFLHTLVSLGCKKTLFIEKKIYLLLSNRKSEIIDHGEFKESDFDDNRQPEIADETGNTLSLKL